MSKQHDNGNVFGDEAIRGADQDLLNREQFVNVLSNAIWPRQGNAPLVVALSGKWGSGKTSVLNMLTEKLKGFDPKPMVVRFNPWLYGDIDQLITMFFRELATRLAKTDHRNAGEIASKLLHTAGLVVGFANSSAGELLKAGAETVDKLKEESSLEDERDKIDSALSEMDQRLVVLIDDVDRLEPKSVQAVMKLLRLTADFTNTTYVVAFDRRIVREALEEQGVPDGAAYLEKIFQVSFDLPLPDESELDRILLHFLSEALEEAGEVFETQRFGNLYHSGFRKRFQHLRDIKRYVNGLRLLYPAVREEVDLIDFMGLELIRCFQPDVYRRIRNAKSFLAPGNLPISYREMTREKVNEGLKEIFEGVEQAQRAPLLDVLKFLFPFIQRVDGSGTHRISVRPEWSQQGLLRAPDKFDTFFLFDVPRREIGRHELSTFRDSLGDIARASEVLAQFVKDQKLGKFLQKLESELEDFDGNQAQHLVELLLDQGDELEFEPMGSFGMSSVILKGIVFSALEHFPDADVRAHLLVGAIKNAESIATPLQVAYSANPEREWCVFSNNDAWERVRAAAWDKAKKAVENETFWDTEEVGTAALRWKDLAASADEEEEVAEAVQSYVEDDECFLRFLESCSNEVRTHGLFDKVSNVGSTIHLDIVSRVLDPEDVQNRLREMAEEDDRAQEILRMIEENHF